MDTIASNDIDTAASAWRTLRLAGVLVAVLGIVAISLPVGTGVAIAYVVGAALLVGGLVHGGHVVTTDGWRGSLWQGMLAVVSILAGALVLANPVIGLLSLTLAAIAYLLVDGAAELVASVRMDAGSGRGWIAASGVLSLALGGLLWIGFPVDALWFVGVVVGLSLLSTGLSMIAVAYGARDVVAEAGSVESGRTRGA